MSYTLGELSVYDITATGCKTSITISDPDPDWGEFRRYIRHSLDEEWVNDGYTTAGNETTNWIEEWYNLEIYHDWYYHIEYWLSKGDEGFEYKSSSNTVHWYITHPFNAQLNIETLPADEYWWIGGGMGTIKGLLTHYNTEPVDPPVPQNFYVHLGFEYSTTYADLDGTHIHFIYTIGNEDTNWIPPNPYIYPFKTVLNNLLPDRTYYYRACMHVGRPPMNVNNFFGAILSFSGMTSVKGIGYEHITAKKAEDDVSKAATGRYYMNKSGIFVYESAKHRDI
jgi:hypothetical protein